MNVTHGIVYVLFCIAAGFILGMVISALIAAMLR